MPIIDVRWFEGRSSEQKAELVRRFTTAICEVSGCRSQDVEVIFHDVRRSDWAQDGKLHQAPS